MTQINDKISLCRRVFFIAGIWKEYGNRECCTIKNKRNLYYDI